MGGRDGQPLRFGILSAANIANVFVNAIAGLPNVTVAAVAARNPDKAAAFAAKYEIPISCTYDELLSNSSVEAVYVPLPTALATDWAVKAANAGKHVLVDKPFDSADGVRSITAACTASGVAFLDGTHFVHSHRMQLVRKALSAQSPQNEGRVLHVNTAFTFPVSLDDPTAIRADPALEPSGALGDVGWYNMRVIVALLGAEVCKDVKAAGCCATMHETLKGVILGACGYLQFGSGQSATFDCGFIGSARQRFEAVTECGSVVVKDFVLPVGSSDAFSAVLPGEGRHELGMEVETTRELGKEGKLEVAWPTWEKVEAREELTQAQSMVSAFVRIVDDPAERAFWAEETEATQSLLDVMYKDAMAKEET